MMNHAPATPPTPAIVILAAGKGTRMKSRLPKVLHPLAGRPLIDHVLELARSLEPDRTIVVVGYRADQVRQHLAGRPGLRFALQEPQLGTGHAVMAAADHLADYHGPVLVLYGDVPGLTHATAAQLLAEHQAQGNALTVLAMDLEQPGAYGRLVTDATGRLTAIVEARDATERQRRITLVNSGIYVIDNQPMLAGLKDLRPDNQQAEYYLTDLVGLFVARGLKVGWSLCPDPAEVAGVNSAAELKALADRLG